MFYYPFCDGDGSRIHRRKSMSKDHWYLDWITSPKKRAVVITQLTTKIRNEDVYIPYCVCVTKEGCPCCIVGEILVTGPRRPVHDI